MTCLDNNVTDVNCSCFVLTLHDRKPYVPEVGGVIISYNYSELILDIWPTGFKKVR